MRPISFVGLTVALWLLGVGATAPALGASPRTYGDLAQVIAPMIALVDSEFDRGQPISEGRRAAHVCHELLADAWGSDFQRYLELESAATAEDSTANVEALQSFRPNARSRDVIAGLRRFLPAIKDLNRVVGRQSRARFGPLLRESVRAVRYLETFNRSKPARQLAILQDI